MNSASDRKRTTLTFHGGADSVTGANFLLTGESARMLIDCGLFQGCDFCEDENYAPFPYEPASITHTLVTHAHIDHVGRIPKLVKDGFRGEIVSTEATKEIAQHLLRDSTELLLRDAQKRGKKPLYGEEDVAGALALWRGVPYGEVTELPEGYALRLRNAGHILGSALVELTREGRRFVATGDLGNDSSELLDPPERVTDAHYLLIESVYGDREHDISGRRDELENIIEDTVARGGDVLIPAFSTERTQDLMYEVRTLMREKRIPSVPVFVDSPLASRITRSFLSHPSYFKREITARIEGGEDIFAFDELRFTASREESEHIASVEGPKIIIAGSGMSNGGRVLSHERRILKDPRSTLLIVGYQSAGSLGRRLLEGEKRVEISLEKIEVKARVEAIFGYSAHRDGAGLLDFVGGSADTLEKVFVAMGEPKSASFLTQRIRDYLGVPAVAPQRGESVVIDL